MSEKTELIQRGKMLVRKKRRIKFIGYMKKQGRKIRYVRVE